MHIYIYILYVCMYIYMRAYIYIYVVFICIALYSAIDSTKLENDRSIVYYIK